MFFFVCNTQHDCNSAIVKLELFGNILLILNANDFECCKKAIYGIKSFSMICNLSIIERVELSSVKRNPPIIQGLESSSIEYNASVPAKLLIINNSNNVKLCIEAMIRAKEHLFK